MRAVDPDSEPVAVRVRRTRGDVPDFIFTGPDFDRFAFVAVDENIVAQRAESEDETAEPVEGKQEDSGEGGPEIGSLPEINKLEDNNLKVQDRCEEGGHEKEPEPVPHKEPGEKEHAQPV